MRERRRPRPMAYGGPSVEKLLGSLPVLADYCRRLDLAGIIDRACPVRDVAILTHGQVIEALVANRLVANRLTSPAPLLRVTDWAQSWAVEEVLGIDPAALNDDRIGRALDGIAPELDRIVGSVGAQAIAAFGIDVSRLHWDMTSISLYGADEQADPDYAAPRFGHPKDRRPDLKQVQAGLAVSGDGGRARAEQPRKRDDRDQGEDRPTDALRHHSATPQPVLLHYPRLTYRERRPNAGGAELGAWMSRLLIRTVRRGGAPLTQDAAWSPPGIGPAVAKRRAATTGSCASPCGLTDT